MANEVTLVIGWRETGLPTVEFIGGPDNVAEAESKLDHPGPGIVEQRIFRNPPFIRRRGYEPPTTEAALEVEHLTVEPKKRSRT
jgi:hypothetical protein